MPLFEFTCRKCGHSFEELLSLAEVEAGDLSCPACHSDRVERGFSAFATSRAEGGSGGESLRGGACGAGGFT